MPGASGSEYSSIPGSFCSTSAANEEGSKSAGGGASSGANVTLLLLPSLEASLGRARRRNEKHAAKTGQDENRFEQEQGQFFRRVWEKYREIARREPDRVVVIEGNLSIDEVHEQIVEAVSERLVALHGAA